MRHCMQLHLLSVWLEIQEPSLHHQHQHNNGISPLTTSSSSCPLPSSLPCPEQSSPGFCVVSLFVTPSAMHPQAISGLPHLPLLPQTFGHHHHQDWEERTLLPARLLNLGRLSIPHEPIPRLEFLHHLIRIVDEREPRGFAPAILCPEPEDGHGVFAGFVEFGQFGPELVLGDVGTGRVEHVADFEDEVVRWLLDMGIWEGEKGLGLVNIHDHLLSTEERVADEFARAQRYGLLAVCHGCS